RRAVGTPPRARRGPARGGPRSGSKGVAPLKAQGVRTGDPRLAGGLVVFGEALFDRVALRAPLGLLGLERLATGALLRAAAGQAAALGHHALAAAGRARLGARTHAALRPGGAIGLAGVARARAVGLAARARLHARVLAAASLVPAARRIAGALLIELQHLALGLDR